MATITITVPDALVPNVRAALARLYGSALVGMTPRQEIAYHLRATLGPHVKALRSGAVDTSAETAARQTAETALATETAIRAAAVAAAEAQAVLDMGGVV